MPEAGAPMRLRYGFRNEAVPEAGAPMQAFGYGRRMTRRGWSSQEGRHARGATGHFDATGRTGGLVAVPVSAGRETRGPAGVYHGDRFEFARYAVESTADDAAMGTDGQVKLAARWNPHPRLSAKSAV